MTARFVFDRLTASFVESPKRDKAVGFRGAFRLHIVQDLARGSGVVPDANRVNRAGHAEAVRAVTARASDMQVARVERRGGAAAATVLDAVDVVNKGAPAAYDRDVVPFTVANIGPGDGVDHVAVPEADASEIRIPERDEEAPTLAPAAIVVARDDGWAVVVLRCVGANPSFDGKSAGEREVRAFGNAHGVIVEVERAVLRAARAEFARCGAGAFSIDAAHADLSRSAGAAAGTIAPREVCAAGLGSAVAARLGCPWAAIAFAFARFPPHARRFAGSGSTKATSFGCARSAFAFAFAGAPGVVAVACAGAAVSAFAGRARCAFAFAHALAPLAHRITTLSAAQTAIGIRSGDAVADGHAFAPRVVFASLLSAVGATLTSLAIRTFAFAGAIGPVAFGIAGSNAAQAAALGFARLAFALIGAFAPCVILAARLAPATLAISGCSGETHPLAFAIPPRARICAGFHSAERTRLHHSGHAVELIFTGSPSGFGTCRRAASSAGSHLAWGTFWVHAGIPATAGVADLATRFAALLRAWRTLALRLALTPCAVGAAHQHAAIATRNHIARVADASAARPFTRRSAGSRAATLAAFDYPGDAFVAFVRAAIKVVVIPIAGLASTGRGRRTALRAAGEGAKK